MQQLLSLRGKLFLCLCVASVALLAFAGTASAAIPIDAKDFTEPIEGQITTAVPIVIAFIAAIFGLTFIIRWVQNRAKSAR